MEILKKCMSMKLNKLGELPRRRTGKTRGEKMKGCSTMLLKTNGEKMSENSLSTMLMKTKDL